jgi:hypothetical protein
MVEASRLVAEQVPPAEVANQTPLTVGQARSLPPRSSHLPISSVSHHHNLRHIFSSLSFLQFLSSIEIWLKKTTMKTELYDDDNANNNVNNLARMAALSFNVQCICQPLH